MVNLDETPKIVRSQTKEQARANIAALFAVEQPTPQDAGKAALNNSGTECPDIPTPSVTQKSRDHIPPENGDILAELPIALLDDFTTGMDQQPFRPYSPGEMEELRDDIVHNGILQPPIVRPKGDGRYEIIAGHNRRTAARMAGYTTIPCIVRNLSDDEAILQMISTNLRQRKKLLPSEKARAYQIRMEAMKRQGFRSDLTSPQAGPRLRSDEILAAETGDSRNQIQRYIRLNYLTPELLNHVDEDKLGLTVGATISYISRDNQEALERFCFGERHLHISQEIADALRQADTDGAIFSEETLPLLLQLSARKGSKPGVSPKVLRRHFPATISKKSLEKTVDAALTQYFRNGGQIL